MTVRPEFPREGGCACGAIRYRLTEDAVGLHVCHCTDCQRITGSAFVMTMTVRREGLEILKGEPQPLAFETVSGISRIDRCCAACGSRLWSEPQKIPNLLALRPGTLDEHDWLEPVAHIFLSSAQPWVPIPEGVLRYQRSPEDPLEPVRRWRGRHAS
mgnify:CR=1 FL=1